MTSRIVTFRVFLSQGADFSSNYKAEYIMTIVELLKRLRFENRIGAKQADLLSDLQEGRVYSLHRELRAFLYIGVLLVIAGVGLTVRQYFAHLGDLAIILALTGGSVAALVYCFVKGTAFAKEQVVSPNIAFDFILFFGCAFYSLDIAYIETHFSVLGEAWKHYLLISAVLFFFLAYRFDNRLVLSMALSTLAAWFGFTLSAQRQFAFEEYYRLYAILYGLVVLGIGMLTRRLAIKKHFFDMYLNFSAHFLCVALISGIGDHKLWSPYFPALMAACVALAFYAAGSRRFLYMLYSLIYGYIGVSIVVVDRIHLDTVWVLIYFVSTSLLMIGLIFVLSRQFKEEK